MFTRFIWPVDLKVSEYDVKVEGQSSGHVDEIVRRSQQVTTPGTRRQSDYQFDGEPRVTDWVNVEESSVRLVTWTRHRQRRLVVESAGVVTTLRGRRRRRHAEADSRNSHRRVSFEAKRRNGDKYEEERDGCQHLKHYNDNTSAATRRNTFLTTSVKYKKLLTMIGRGQKQACSSLGDISIAIKLCVTTYVGYWVVRYVKANQIQF